ncbi:MAG: hypothetical protein ACO3R4_05705, partial [Litorivicinaceae bacterium]
MDYIPGTEFTLIPGIKFDDGKHYYFQSKHQRGMVLDLKTDEVLAEFPREIELPAGATLSKEFLDETEGSSDSGTRFLMHRMYPVPDVFFKRFDEHRCVLPRSSGQNLRANAGVGESKHDEVSEHGEPQVLQLPLEAAEHVVIKRIWEQHIRKAHHVSMEMDVQLYEHTHRTRVSAKLRALLPRCTACDVAKIQAQPQIRTRHVRAEDPQSDVSADLLIDFPKSPEGYRYGLHMVLISNGFGVFIPLKKRSCDVKLLHWLKWLYNQKHVHPARLHIDGGELETQRVADYCESNGIQRIVNIAHAHTNNSVERRHRTLTEMANAQMHRGGAPATLMVYALCQANVTINVYPSATMIK